MDTTGDNLELSAADATRLREVAAFLQEFDIGDAATLFLAADDLDRLRAENAKLAAEVRAWRDAERDKQGEERG